MANAGESVCHNDPNFSVICSFLDKYSELLGLPPISFQDLQRYLEDTKDVSKVLIDLHVWLLRRIGRHSVTAERLDRSLIKFCYWFSDVDAWEVERFGYKHSKLSTKLHILKNLLECQFDNNVKFKDKINDIDPEKMRFHPIGRDKNGMAYWYLLDHDFNLLVYRDEQDDVDDETWELVCKDRNDLASLITDLTQNKELSNKQEETSSSNKSSKEGSPEAEDCTASVKNTENCGSEITSQSDLKMTIKLERLSEKDLQIAKEQRLKVESENSENILVKQDISVKDESQEKVSSVEGKINEDSCEIKSENNEDSKTNCKIKHEPVDQTKIDNLENAESLKSDKTVCSVSIKHETDPLVKEEKEVEKEEKPDGEKKTVEGELKEKAKDEKEENPDGEKQTAEGELKEKAEDEKEEKPASKIEEKPANEKEEKPDGEKEENADSEKVEGELKEKPGSEKEEKPGSEKEEKPDVEKDEQPVSEKVEKPASKKEEKPEGELKEKPTSEKEEKDDGEKEEKPDGENEKVEGELKERSEVEKEEKLDGKKEENVDGEKEVKADSKKEMVEGKLKEKPDGKKEETAGVELKAENADGELKEEKVAPDKREPDKDKNKPEKETPISELECDSVKQNHNVTDSSVTISETTHSDTVRSETSKTNNAATLSDINDNNSSNATDSSLSIDQNRTNTESLKDSNQNSDLSSLPVDSDTITGSEVKEKGLKNKNDVTQVDQEDNTKTNIDPQPSVAADTKEDRCVFDHSDNKPKSPDDIQDVDKSISKENENSVTDSTCVVDVQNKDGNVPCDKKRVKFVSKKGRKGKQKGKSSTQPSVERNKLKENHDVDKPEIKDGAIMADVSDSDVSKSVKGEDSMMDEDKPEDEKEAKSGDQQPVDENSCDKDKRSKTDREKEDSETVANSTSKPVSTRKRAAKASTEEQVENDVCLTRTRRTTRQMLSQKEKVSVNGIGENKKSEVAEADVKDNGKRVKRKEEVNGKGEINEKVETNEKGETSSDEDSLNVTKGSAKQTQKGSKSGLKRSAAEVEYKEPVEKKAKRGRGTGRAAASRVRAKRKVAASEESSDSSDSDDVPLSMIKGQERSSRGSRASKGRVRQRGKKDDEDEVPSSKKLVKSKKTKSCESGSSDESEEPVQKNPGRGSATKRKAPVEQQEPDSQEPDTGMTPRRSTRACVARSRLIEESLSEEEQPSSSEASIETPSPTDSDDEDFFCPKGRNAQRVAARIESKVFQPGPDDTPCCRCQLCDHPEWMLLCDKCDAGYHTACLRPPIMIIPDGDWFCPPCEHKFLIEKLQEQLASLDVFLKKKARLVKRKERLAFVGISLDNILKEDTRKCNMLREEFEDEETTKTFVPKSRRDRRDRKKERDCDFEPLPEEVYAKRSCRTRKTMNYNFTEYDELINSAIQEDIKDVDLSQPPGIGRGKDMSNIMQAGEGEEQEEEEVLDGKPPPVLSHVIATKKQRKGRRLTQLDSDDNDDDSEEFQLSEESVSEASAEEAYEGVSEESEDWRPGQVASWRSVRKSSRSSKGKWSRSSRYNKDFVVDDEYESDDSANNRRSTRSKTKRQVNYREFNSDESEAVETSESEESANLSELCSEDSDDKSKKSNRRVIRSDSEEEGTGTDAPKPKEILPRKKTKKKLKDSESETNEESSAEEKLPSRPRRKSAGKVNFKEDEDTSSGLSDGQGKPMPVKKAIKKAKRLKKKSVLNSDSETEDEAMDSKTKDKDGDNNSTDDEEDSDSKQDVCSADTKPDLVKDGDKNSKCVLADGEENRTLENVDQVTGEDKLPGSQQTFPPSGERPPQGFSEVPEGLQAYRAPGEPYGPQGQPDFSHSYGPHHPYMHPQYGAAPGSSFPQGQHVMSQRSPHQMGSPPQPHVSPQHMQGQHPQGTPPHGMQHPIMGAHGPQQAPYPGGAQHRAPGYYMQGGQQRVPGPQSMMGPCGSPPHAPQSTPPQHPPHGTPPHMGSGQSHISPPHHPTPPSGPGPMQPGPHPHQYGPYPNMYGPPQGPYSGNTVHPRPGIPGSTGPHMSPPMSIPTSQHMPPSVPSHRGPPQLNGPSRHLIPHRLNGPPSHNFQTLQRPNVPPQSQVRPLVPQDSRNISDPPAQEMPRHLVSRGPQLTTMTDTAASSASRGFMMDNLLKDNGQPRKEPTGEDDDLEDVSDIVNYVMNDDYFKDHT